MHSLRKLIQERIFGSVVKMLCKTTNVSLRWGNRMSSLGRWGRGQSFGDGDQITIGNLSMRHEIRTRLMEKLALVEV